MAEPNEEKTFTQAEVDEIVGKRVAKATRGMPSAEELAAFNTWKANQQSEADKLANMTRERDDANAALAAANAKLESYDHEKFLLSKGVPADDVDYYAYRIGKLVDDKTDFKAAAEKYLEEHKPKKAVVDMTGRLSGSGKETNTPNQQMNALFRSIKS